MNLIDILFTVQYMVRNDRMTKDYVGFYLRNIGVDEALIPHILGCYNFEKQVFESVCRFYDENDTKPQHMDIVLRGE